MYDAVEDPYCYPGTTVLINKAGLETQEELSNFELEISTQRANEPLPQGLFSKGHYLAIHRHLFQDVYRWAGKIRNVRISKSGNMFCFPEHISSQLDKLFEALRRDRFLRGLGSEDFAQPAAHFLTELNAIHAFREGNGRAQLAFMTMLADRAGHPLNLDLLEEVSFFDAVVTSFNGDEEPLRKAIAAMI